MTEQDRDVGRPLVRRVLGSPSVRTIAIVGIIVSAILGTSQLIGAQSAAESTGARSNGGQSRADVARGDRANGPYGASPHAWPFSTPERDDASPTAAPPSASDSTPGDEQEPLPEVFEQPIVVGPGQPPLPAEQDGPFGARMTTGTQQVALTFDDGPDPTYTPQVLALLRAYQIKATFCVVGQNAAAFPDLIRAIAADGHTLCNHTWAHDLAFAKKSTSAMKAELERTTAAIHEAVPTVKVSYFRQPGGAWSGSVVAVAKELGMSSLHWAVDPTDWNRPGTAAIVSCVEDQADRGSIVLMHDGGGDRTQTVAALKVILPNLEQRFALTALPAGTDPPLSSVRDRLVPQGKKATPTSGP